MHGNILSGSDTQIRQASNSNKDDEQIASYFPRVFLLKFKRLKSITFVNIDAHQDDVKSFEQMSFLEQLNVKCDARAKVLMLNALEDEVIHFSLELSSTYVIIATNHLILNHPKDIRLHVYLIKCEEYLKKALKMSNL